MGGWRRSVRRVGALMALVLAVTIVRSASAEERVASAPCGSTDVTFSVASLEGSMGRQQIVYRLAARGNAECTLNGFPALELRSGAAVLRPDPTTDAYTIPAGEPETVVVAPRRPATILAETTLHCFGDGNEREWATSHLQLPGGGTVAVEHPDTVWSCTTHPSFASPYRS